ncbi:MAG TPA: sulfatase, partial [Clostridiales bacterium]|nr:sulfatase [Clostridiales bacterium]
MEEKTKAKRCYLASISEIDEYLGHIIDYLKIHQLYDDAVIIFTTDHGDHLGSRGLFCKNFCAADQVYNIP